MPYEATQAVGWKDVKVCKLRVLQEACVCPALSGGHVIGES